MTYDTLKVTIGEDKVGVITMSRPDALNAMNTRMMEELRTFSGFTSSDRAACVLIGEGARGFAPAPTSRSARA